MHYPYSPPSIREKMVTGRVTTLGHLIRYQIRQQPRKAFDIFKKNMSNVVNGLTRVPIQIRYKLSCFSFLHLVAKYDPERLNKLLEEGAVKLHIFQPSGRTIWTIVGKDNEHWADLELGFCSCKSYYYKTLSNGIPCYHLLCIQLAKQHNKFVTIKFHDTEYTYFINALLSDTTCKLLS